MPLSHIAYYISSECTERFPCYLSHSEQWPLALFSWILGLDFITSDPLLCFSLLCFSVAQPELHTSISPRKFTNFFVYLGILSFYMEDLCMNGLGWNQRCKCRLCLFFSPPGVPGVKPERYREGLEVKHCALSLVGEPIMYPEINGFIRLLHSHNISSFLVTNAQFPEEIRCGHAHAVFVRCVLLPSPLQEFPVSSEEGPQQLCCLATACCLQEFLKLVDDLSWLMKTSQIAGWDERLQMEDEQSTF